MQHVRGIDQFFADADDGTLPAFSIVDPDFNAYSEENPQDIRKGGSFAAEVINRVLHGKGWPYTLLIWVYDEHGGYYDHVPPPPAPLPDDIEGQSAIGGEGRLTAFLRPVFPGLVKSKENLDKGPDRYDRYGFRVPAVIVSPYARPEYVCSEILDHTSVLKLVEEKWNLPALTARDACPSSCTGASSASHAPSANRPATRRATCPASRVFPDPPGPVTSRHSASSPATSPTGPARPTKLVSAAGKPCTPPAAVSAADHPTPVP
jgi:phospholipase C